MKKFLMATVCILSFVMLGIGLTACGERPITSIAYVQDSVKSDYKRFESVDTSNIQIVVRFEDGHYELVTGTNNGITVGGLSTEDVGTQKANIVYKGKTTSFYYTVSDELTEGAVVIGVENPDFIATVAAKKVTYDNADKTNGEDHYYVGTANFFKLAPKVTFLRPDGSTFLGSDYRFDMTVEEYDEDSHDWVTWDEEERVVLFDNDTDFVRGNYHFSAAALGKQLKITLNPEESGDYDFDVVSFDFKVVDGYNVYTAEQLSVFDNSPEYYSDGARGNGSVWHDFKIAHNIPLYNIDTVILHSDIEINRACLANGFFWADGSLKDFTNIYNHYSVEDHPFTFIGNFFSIDASKVPMITHGDTEEDEGALPEGEAVSHAALFSFNTHYGWTSPGTLLPLGSEYLFKNTSLFGNAQHTNNMTAFGGLSMIRAAAKDAVVENVFARAFIDMLHIDLSLHAEDGKDNLITARNCNFADSFSCMYYTWNANIRLENVKSENAGGPFTAICTSSEDSLLIPSFFADPDCVFIGNLDGEEAWFSSFNPALVSQMFILMRSISDVVAQTVPDYSIANIVEEVGEQPVHYLNFIGVQVSGTFTADHSFALQSSLSCGNGYITDMELLSDVMFSYDVEEGEGKSTIVESIVEACIHGQGTPPVLINSSGEKMFFVPGDALNNEAVAGIALMHTMYGLPAVDASHGWFFDLTMTPKLSNQIESFFAGEEYASLYLPATGIGYISATLQAIIG